jgi:hypothetical protein
VPHALDTSEKRFALPLASYTFKFEEVVPHNPYDTRDSQYERYHKLDIEEDARRAE